ncbi:MAG: MFS transporter [Motiliproteus sp.]|nr:MFS transporter [Motiliproteus sp.]MCW9054111.1 MFS transporter [Motiliproteus sp.]
MLKIFEPLKDHTFRWLFLGQLISLIGTGLTTVALALLAFDLSPSDAGLVLGVALAIKMVAYLSVAPVVGGYASRLPRRRWLAGLNVARATLVAVLPVCSEVWQLFLLMFLLNALAAGYTPVYQALLPDILPDEPRYTEALSLSRMAMEMESLMSPALAALLLIFTGYTLLFQLNAIAFIGAALLLLAAQIPNAKISDRSGGIWQHVSFGIRSYIRTPRLRGVLLLNLALSAAGAMIIVNTVVYVRSVLGLSEQAVPLLMIAAGLGSMLAAILLPKLLDRWPDRSVMLWGAALLVAALSTGLLQPGYLALFPIWFIIGIGSSVILIPTGRVVRNSCGASDRNDFFSASFALTHGMWLVAYLLSGWLGNQFGMSGAFGGLAVVCLLATLMAARYWSKEDPDALWHQHPAIQHQHLHVHDQHHQHEHQGDEGPEPHSHPHHHPEHRHRHRFTIDEHHLKWPG